MKMPRRALLGPRASRPPIPKCLKMAGKMSANQQELFGFELFGGYFLKECGEKTRCRTSLPFAADDPKNNSI